MKVPPESHVPDPGRRRFWRQLIGHAAAACDELRGRPQLSMAEIQYLPDDILAEVVPVFREDGDFSLESGSLYEHASHPDRRHCVYKCTGNDELILQRFHSGTSLGDIGSELERECGLHPGAGFIQVRRLFIDLAQAVICHPAGPVELPLQQGITKRNGNAHEKT
jgi:hypothetical protein